MAKTPDTPIAKFVADLGGPAKVGAQVGITPAAVRAWAYRSSVPRTIWPELLDAYPHLTIEKLRDIEARAA